VGIEVRQALRPIRVGDRPVACRLTTGEDILLVVDAGSNDLAVFRTFTNSLITIIPVGHEPRDVALKSF
jgi:YVTN family beta-propeller protein